MAGSGASAREMTRDDEDGFNALVHRPALNTADRNNQLSDDDSGAAPGSDEPLPLHHGKPTQTGKATQSKSTIVAYTDQAASRVFHSPELLESVLLSLTFRELFRLQRVSKAFKHTIEGSPMLRRAMFLEADKSLTEATINPLLFERGFKIPDWRTKQAVGPPQPSGRKRKNERRSYVLVYDGDTRFPDMWRGAPVSGTESPDRRIFCIDPNVARYSLDEVPLFLDHEVRSMYRYKNRLPRNEFEHGLGRVESWRKMLVSQPPESGGATKIRLISCTNDNDDFYNVLPVSAFRCGEADTLGKMWDEVVRCVALPDPSLGA